MNLGLDKLNEAEHEHISTSLQVEQLEVNLFRSKSLWLPLRSKGVFGGQVISQALVSATNCVSNAFALHVNNLSLYIASASTPIVYQVDHVRDGKSYTTRAVRAIQNGRAVFIMLCSFHKPESWQPSYQWRMPDVPPPEQCASEEDRFRGVIQDRNSPPPIAKMYEEMLSQRERSPIAIKNVKFRYVDEKGIIHFMYWMKARDSAKYPPSFQKCILAYISDMRFIYTAVSTVGLKYGADSGPQYLGMNVGTSSLDHTVWFYEHDFDCADWLLFEMECPRTGSGRAIIHGRIFTRDGKLVAVASQEGVLRAKIRGPDEPKEAGPSAKL